MSKMLLGISSDYLYKYNKEPKLVSDLHKPYFLAFCSKEKNINSARKELINIWNNNNSTDNVFSKIDSIGEIEKYRSFWDFDKKWDVFKVYTVKSYLVPEVSDYLFFNLRVYGA